MMELNLQQFAGTLTVTVNKDDGITTATASPASSLDEGDTVTLSITPASGKELDEIKVMSGGVTPEYDPDDGWTFTMGDSNVVLAVTSKINNGYMVVENTLVSVNGVKTELTRNMMLKYSPAGAVIGADCTATAITLSADAVDALVKSGAIVKV